MKCRPILLSMLLLIVSLSMAASDLKTQRDSLLNLLNAYPVGRAERLPLLNQLTYCSEYAQWQTYPMILLREARALHNREYEMQATYTLARYGFFFNSIDMEYWIDRAAEVALEEKQYDRYFGVKVWQILSYEKKSFYSAAADSIRTLHAFAHEINNQTGQILTDILKGFNMICEGDSLEGSQFLETLETNILSYEGYYLSLQIFTIRILSENHPNPMRRMFYLGLLQQMTDEYAKKNDHSMEAQWVLAFYPYITNCIYVNEYLHRWDLDKAFLYLRRAEVLLRNRMLWPLRSHYNKFYFECLNQSGQYDKAGTLIDEIIALDRSVGDVMDVAISQKKKGKLLMKLGKYDEALQQFSLSNMMFDSLKQVAYARSLDEMRKKSSIDKMKIANAEVQLNSVNINTRLNGLYVFLGLCMIFLFVAIYLFYYHRHISTNLKKARDKTKEAANLESLFLTNMNHEIRTPLNAIVGFSQLMIEEQDPASREYYMKIIEQNNEQLQRIISNVLDISRIESGSLQLYKRECSLDSIFQEIRREDLKGQYPEVILQYKGWRSEMIYVDPLRLKQILEDALIVVLRQVKRGYLCIGYEFVGKDRIFFYLRSNRRIFKDSLSKDNMGPDSFLTELNTDEKLTFKIVCSILEKMKGTLSMSYDKKNGSELKIQITINDKQD